MKREPESVNSFKKPRFEKGALKKQVKVGIDSDIVEYFKEESKRTGLLYDVLINTCLKSFISGGRHIDY